MSARRLRLGILADDLTGAMDVAGPFAPVLPDTRVVALPAATTPAELAGADVVSVNTASRHLPAAEASARVREAAVLLAAGDPRVLLKKIDSTLRGNVVAETLALREAMGCARVLVAPGFPAQGRTVEQGVVHVRGHALRDTEFARDALSPPPLEPLQVVFARALPQAQVLRVAAGGELPPRTPGQIQILIGDCAEDAHLDALVRGLGQDLEGCLLVGSAGIAAALARAVPGVPAAVPAARARGVLFLVGSRSAQSDEQVRALGAVPGLSLLEAPNGCLRDPLPEALGSVCVLRSTAGEYPEDSLTVARSLAQAGLTVLARGEHDAVVATGGDTAVAFVEALQAGVLQVYGDLLPGVPCSSVGFAGRTLRLVTKAGGFGHRDTFLEVLRLLRG